MTTEDASNYTYHIDDLTHVIKEPDDYKWSFKFNEDHPMEMRMLVAPNKFHRFMQKLMFGFIWKKLK